jgi:hypothetical protein
MIYAQEIRPAVKAELEKAGSDTGVTVIGKEMGSRWKAMTDEQKAVSLSVASSSTFSIPQRPPCGPLVMLFADWARRLWRHGGAGRLALAGAAPKHVNLTIRLPSI